MFMPTVESGAGFERCPEGNHLAVCYEVIDLGTQETTWEGETKRQRKIWIGWETTSEQMEDGRPFVIGRRYTFSSHEKSTLRKDLESWRGKKFTDEEIAKFDIKSLIGCACFLNVVHSTKGDRTYANITTVAALPKGTATPELVNPKTYVSLDLSEYQPEMMNLISERMAKVVKSSPEWKNANAASVGETDETQPF